MVMRRSRRVCRVLIGLFWPAWSALPGCWCTWFKATSSASNNTPGGYIPRWVWPSFVDGQRPAPGSTTELGSGDGLVEVFGDGERCPDGTVPLISSVGDAGQGVGVANVGRQGNHREAMPRSGAEPSPSGRYGLAPTRSRR